MAKKLKQMTESDQQAMVDAVRQSAQQIWQAGLGAFAKAQHEGGAWFDKLVQEGAALHELTRSEEGAQPEGVAGKMSRLASGSWDKIEKVFEDRVARALRSLGVPSRDDIADLRREVAELRAMLAEAPAAEQAAARAPAKARAKAAAVPAPKRPPRASARQH